MKELTILEYYQERNKDPNYVEEFQSTSDKKSGKTFWYINTNFRSIKAFIDTFNKFKAYDSKDRSSWDVYSNNEQKAKHWTVRMQQSKLFRKNEGKYILTAKGKAFLDFVNMINNPSFCFSDNEQWIITYLFILNGYFNLKPNYVINRTLVFFESMKRSGILFSDLEDSFSKLIGAGDDVKREDLFCLDGFWYINFWNDKDFLSLFKNSTVQEKNDLFNYIVTIYRTWSKEQKRKDLINWKFVQGGQYMPSSIIDDAKTLYATYYITKSQVLDIYSLVDVLYRLFEQIMPFNKKKVIEFVKMHKDVFDVIFNEAILNKKLDDELNENEEEDVDTTENHVEEKIDDTTTQTQQRIRQTSQILKRMAKDRADNKCEVELINSCRYFTSKESGKNYLEIHHLIPFEFSNDFENTLEVLDNYVALCPHCHRLLHFGVDRERKGILTYLYNARIDGLKTKGLFIELKQLFAYYDIEE